MEETMDIRQVYALHSRRLYNMSLRIVGDPSDAEEVMHDTLLKYHDFARKKELRELSGWLSSVCIRKSIDKLRERHRYRNFLERCARQEADEASCGSSEDIEYDIGRIRDAMASLPDHYRLVLSLHLIEGYDYEEISQITSAKESTIRTLYMRGRQKLADMLKKQHNGQS